VLGHAARRIADTPAALARSTGCETRRRIRNANEAVISSVMEGGANVIVEGITATR
jgi:hypothetical protein